MEIHSKFDEVDISVYHLVFIGNSINNIIEAFSKVIYKIDDLHEKVLYVSTFSIVLIQTVSFLDEYHNFLKTDNEELNNTIKVIKKTVKPATDQIKKWRDINEFRNNVLAHNLRDRKKMMTVFEKGLSSYDIPKNSNDLMVLQNCISAIKQTFESAFASRLQILQEYLDKLKIPPKENKFKNSKEAKKVAQTIYNQVNTNIAQLKSSVLNE